MKDPDFMHRELKNLKFLNRNFFTQNSISLHYSIFLQHKVLSNKHAYIMGLLQNIRKRVGENKKKPDQMQTI